MYCLFQGQYIYSVTQPISKRHMKEFEANFEAEVREKQLKRKTAEFCLRKIELI